MSNILTPDVQYMYKYMLKKDSDSYSVRKLFIGFTTAAFIL